MGEMVAAVPEPNISVSLPLFMPVHHFVYVDFSFFNRRSLSLNTVMTLSLVTPSRIVPSSSDRCDGCISEEKNTFIVPTSCNHLCSKASVHNTWSYPFSLASAVALKRAP